MVAPQTKTVELDADLVERAQREADKRGITLMQLIAERRAEARAEDREDEARQRRRAGH